MEHEQVKQKEHTPKASYGYGGKFGVEKDRMDKVGRFVAAEPRLVSPPADVLFCSVSAAQVAMGHDYVAQVEQHSSQKDMAKGFGGKFGVQKDRVDKVRTQT